MLNVYKEQRGLRGRPPSGPSAQRSIRALPKSIKTNEHNQTVDETDNKHLSQSPCCSVTSDRHPGAGTSVRTGVDFHRPAAVFAFVTLCCGLGSRHC